MKLRKMPAKGLLEDSAALSVHQSLLADHRIEMAKRNK